MKIARTKTVKKPERGTVGSAGIDFFMPEKMYKHGEELRISSIIIDPGEQCLIPSGVHVNIPEDHVLVMLNKSGVASKKQLLVGAQVIDEDYQGEIHINLHNVGNKSIMVNPGDKIIQGLLLPVVKCDIEEELLEYLYDGKTVRGAGGFGSTNER